MEEPDENLHSSQESAVDLDCSECSEVDILKISITLPDLPICFFVQKESADFAKSQMQQIHAMHRHIVEILASYALFYNAVEAHYESK